LAQDRDRWPALAMHKVKHVLCGYFPQNSLM
jgi:hypothetical protein